MYNEEIKQQYIADALHRNNFVYDYLTKKFEQSSRFEQMHGVDLCCFTMEEIIEFYKSMCTTSISSLIVLNSQMSIYANWCLSRNLVPDHQNHFYEITNTMLHDCVNQGLAIQKYVAREDLIHTFDDIPNVSDQFLLLAIFEGICGEQYSELVGLEPKDFCVVKNGDTGTEKVTVELNSGRELEVSKELYHLAVESAEEYRMFSTVDGEENKLIKYVDYDPEIIKVSSNVSDFETARLKAKRFYSRILRTREITGMPFVDKQSLLESGRIDYILRLCKEDDQYDIFTEIKSRRNEIEYRYGRIQSLVQYVKRYFPESGQE